MTHAASCGFASLQPMTRPFPYVFLSLLLLCQSVLAQGSGAYSLRFKLSKRHFADSIAIEYDDGRVFVPVRVGGTVRRFLPGTGAAQAIVYDDTDLARSPRLGTISSIDALGTQASVPVVALPPLTLGQLTLTGLHATVHQRPPMRQKIDGIVGFDLVCKGLLMKIDTRQRLLVLTDRKKHFRRESPGHECRYQVLPYRHTPYVSVQPFRGYTEQVLFDTGSPFLYLINHHSFAQALDSCLAQNPAQIADTVAGSFVRGLHGRERQAPVVCLQLDSLVFAGHALRHVPARTTQGLSHLGGPLLGHGAVIFMPRRRLRFIPF